MPFDIKNPADLSALKNEVTNDPVSIGYQPVENTNELLKLLNDPANNTGSESAAGRVLSGVNLLEICMRHPIDFDASINTASKRVFIQGLFAQEEITKSFKEELVGPSGLFPSGDIRDDIISEVQGKLSRAEVLFGEDTVINKRDWARARDHG